MTSNTAGKSVVVLAVDVSKVAFKVVEFATKHFNRPEYTLLVLHVIKKKTPVPFGSAAAAAFTYDAAEEQQNAQEDDAEIFLTTKLLPAVEKACTNTHVEAVIKRANGNSASLLGTMIDDFAQQHDAVMIVMASHNKRPLMPMTEIYLGSVTSYCAHHAKVPVAIVH